MARTHGKLFCSIWNDRDFRGLDRVTQGMYMFLLSQDRLDYAGVLSITMRNWASTAEGLTVGEVEDTLEVLEKHRFIVMDRDTEELMVRTFVRRDELWRQPKMMLAVVSAAKKIQSPRLRLALLAELDRLPLDELPNEPTKSGAPPARQVVARCVESLRGTLFAPDDDPGSKVRETQSETLSDSQAGWVRDDSDPSPVDEPVDSHDIAGQDSAGNPSGLGLANPHARARAQSSFNFHLSTTNNTNPTAAPDANEDLPPESVPGIPDADEPRGAEEATESAKPAKKRNRAPAADIDAAERDEAARKILKWWWEEQDPKPAGEKAWFACLAVVKALLKAGHDRHAICIAAADIGSPLTIPRMEIQLGRIAGKNVIQLPAQRPSTTDARVDAARAMGAELQAEADAQRDAQLEARGAS